MSGERYIAPSKSRPDIELLQALNAAAASLQQSAHTEEAVFQAFKTEVVKLGLRGVLTMQDVDKSYMLIKSLAMTDKIMQFIHHIEDNTGTLASNWRIPVNSVDAYQQVIELGQPVFLADNQTFLKQVLPDDAKPYIEEFTELLGQRPLILAPMISKEKTYGVIYISSPDLLSEHTPSVAAFANHMAVAIDNARLFVTLEASEARFKSIIEVSPDGIMIVSQDGIIRYANRAYHRMLGYKVGELIGQSVQVTILPEDRSKLRLQFEEIMQLKSPPGVTVETEMLRRDGSYFPAEVNWNYLDTDKDNRTIVANIRDITDHKTQKERLRKLSRAVEQSPSSVYITDTEGIIEYVNPMFTKVTGYTPEETIGSEVGFLNSGEHPVEFFNDLWATIGSGKEWRGDIRNRRKDGSLYWELISITPIKNEAGKITHYLAVRIEDTERRQAEQALKIQARHQAALFQLSADLVATLDEITLCQCVVEGLQEWLDYDHVALFLVDAETSERVLVSSIGWTHMPPRWRILPGQGLSDHAILTGKLSYTPDITQDPNHLPGLFNGSEVDVPLIVEDVVVGVLIIASQEVNAFSEDDFKVLIAAANQTAVALQRARKHQAVKEAEDRYRQLVEISPDAIIVYINRKFTYVNPAGLRLFAAKSLENLLNKPIMDLVHPDYKDVVLERVRQLEEYRKPQPLIEERFIRLDGQVIDVDVVSIPMIYEGKPAVQVILRDITENKESQKALRRRNRELAMFNQIIATSVAENEPEVLLTTACQQLAVAFGFPVATAGLLNGQKTAESITTAYVFDPEQIAIPRFPTITPEDPIYQYLLKRKEPLIVHDVTTDQRIEAIQKDLDRAGIVSMLVLPLIIDDDVVGAFRLGSFEERLFLEEEVNLAGRVAEQVAGVLARVKLSVTQQELQEQMRQARRLEAIGLLAGGIAHDFNNILTGINGYTELLQQSISEDDPNQEFVDEILYSAQRATDLIGQLLTFSHKRVAQPQAINCNVVIEKMTGILQRIIGNENKLKTNLDTDLWPVHIDPSQLEQVILNLVVNARDAMPDGGQVTVRTKNIMLDEEYTTQHLGSEPGKYVQIAVIDTGIGMSAEVKNHLFEPFYTTKGPGRGTGLGLSTVFSIIKQSKGNIWVYSEEGYGSTFKIQFPCTDQQVSSRSPDQNKMEMPRGSETILLVEHDNVVRQLAHQVLNRLGYAVLKARTALEALYIVGKHPDKIDLLISDMIMPKIDGRDLAAYLTQSFPGLKVLFMSGFTHDTVEYHDLKNSTIPFLEKPFTAASLALKVRAVLDEDQLHEG